MNENPLPSPDAGHEHRYTIHVGSYLYDPQD
jgi:hypothetical protein